MKIVERSGEFEKGGSREGGIAIARGILNTYRLWLLSLMFVAVHHLVLVVQKRIILSEFPVALKSRAIQYSEV